jgi:hypothetical protein
MKARDELLEQLKKETLEKLGAFCKSNEYSNFLKKLIVQGLIKIEEQVVEVQTRAEDKQLVSKIVSWIVVEVLFGLCFSLSLVCLQLNEAVNEYKNLMSTAGFSVNPRVTLSDTAIPAKNW